jgi:hypothetical protein
MVSFQKYGHRKFARSDERNFNIYLVAILSLTMPFEDFECRIGNYESRIEEFGRHQALRYPLA